MFNPLEPLSTIYARIHDSVEKWNEPAQVANQITNVAEQAAILILKSNK
jgi:hypothetical protein